MSKRFLKRAVSGLLALSFIIPMAMVVPAGAEGTATLSVGHLLTNGVWNPEAIDQENPVFAWQMDSNARGTVQSAYQILVKSALKGETVWDSGKIASDVSASVEYAGPALSSDTAYTWQVRIWDQNDTASDYSDPAEFRVGLSKEDWTAKYIWDGTENENDFAYFRKTFAIQDKEIAEAVVYTSAHNDYQLYLNGDFLGAGPARSNPITYGQYCAYDITEQLQPGDNTFAALAHWHGVWSDSGVNASPAYILEARIRYADGTSQTVVTDETWKVQDETAYVETAPVYFGHYGGAKNRASIRFDARKESEGWNTTTCDESGWDAATVVDRSSYNLSAQLVGEQKEMEFCKPVKVYQEGDTWFAEFDKCLTGWPKLQLKENAAGDEIKLQYWEVQRGWGDAGYDTYLCKGGSETCYAPFVRHTSFKIIEITGYKGTLTVEDVTGIVAHSETQNNGTFESSDDRLNAVFAMCERSGRQNIQQGIISVDANREQSPWTADSWNIGIGCLYNHQDTMLIDKIIKDYAGEQQSNGNFLTCSPAIQYNSQMAEWSMYWPMLLWQEYLFKGNTTLLADTYGNLTRFLDYMAQFEGASGLYNPEGWRSSDYAGGILENGGENIATNCQLYMNFEIAAEIARLVGQTADSERYTQKAEKLKDAINKNLLVDGERYRTTPASQQTAALGTAWALRSGVVPEAFRERVTTWFAQQKSNYNVGGYGGDALYNGLYAAGLGEIATADYARYDQMLETNNTNWESFGALSIDNMGNHAWTAYPSYLLPKYVGGVQPTSGGFADVDIRPDTGGLEWAKVSTPSLKGNIDVSWKKDSESQLTMTVTIPANVRANIYVPDNDMSDLTVTENGSNVYSDDTYVPGVDGITGASYTNGYVVVTAGSGTYTFTVTGTPKHTPPIGEDGSVIQDNAQAEHTGEGWHVNTTDEAGMRYGDSFASAPGVSGTATATAVYTFENVTAGKYEIYAWWTTHENRATDAPYTIQIGESTDTVRCNQEQNGGTWNLLGTYELTEAGTVTVTLSNDANEYVISDAIKLTPVASGELTAKEQLLLYLYEVEKTDLTQYKPEAPIAAFEQALAEAWAVCESPDTTNEQAAAAMEALEQALAALEPYKKNNLALGAEVTATDSLSIPGSWGTEYLTDGYIAKDNNGRIGYSSNEYQSPELTEPIVLTVDLGVEKTFDTITFVPRLGTKSITDGTANFMVDYQIKVSSDNVNYEMVYEKTDEPDPNFQPLNVEVGQQRARYIQLEVTKLGNYANDEGGETGRSPHRLQLTEIEVYRSNENLALDAEVTASVSVSDPGHWGAEYLTDGYIAKDNDKDIGYTTDPYLQPELEEPIIITIDLGQQTTFNTVTLVPRLAADGHLGGTANFMSDYEILVSTDNQTYNSVYSMTDQSDPSKQPLEVSFAEQNAQYIQLKVTKLGQYATDEEMPNNPTPYRLQLSEIEVYNLPAKTYTVTFDTNEGTPIEPVTVEAGMSVTKPQDPTRPGYVFKGWYSDKDLNTLYSFTAPVNEDITLYAKWEAIEINYDLTGDNTVDLLDVLAAMKWFAAAENTEDWPLAESSDVNRDGKVTLEDLILIVMNFTVK